MEDQEHNNFRDGRVHVVSKKCSTCIFRPGNLMGLRAGRVKGMVEESIESGGVITCHKTLGTDANAICRGYYDSYGEVIPVLKIAAELDMIDEDEPCP